AAARGGPADVRGQVLPAPRRRGAPAGGGGAAFEVGAVGAVGWAGGRRKSKASTRRTRRRGGSRRGSQSLSSRKPGTLWVRAKIAKFRRNTKDTKVHEGHKLVRKEVNAAWPGPPILS